MEPGLSLGNGVAIEDSVLGTVPEEPKNLVDEKEFRECLGLQTTALSNTERIEGISIKKKKPISIIATGDANS
ncbi:MAG: hypothetical protein JEZ12_08490 [Desulfobacterium sp.]|nr:hypothetical protein [Desulfobacterium sp.]